VVRAILLCSHEPCAAVYEFVGPLEEAGALACECGCGLQVIGWPDELHGSAKGSTLELTL
jgi:hypothetical protein